MADRAHLSIGEVLSLLREEFPNVTISKIRFLESQGLLDPERTPSGYRKFYEEDVERLRWILRQQQENFLPLKVIKGRLGELPDGPTMEIPAAAPGSPGPGAGGPGPGGPAPGGPGPRRAGAGRLGSLPGGAAPMGGAPSAVSSSNRTITARPGLPSSGGTPSTGPSGGLEAGGAGGLVGAGASWPAGSGGEGRPAGLGERGGGLGERGGGLGERGGELGGPGVGLGGVGERGAELGERGSGGGTNADGGRAGNGGGGAAATLPAPGTRRGVPSTMGDAGAGAMLAGGTGAPGGPGRGIIRPGTLQGPGSSRPGVFGGGGGGSPIGMGGALGGMGDAVGEPAGGNYTIDELATATGLSEAAIDELSRFGLISGRDVGGTTYFDEDAATVASLAAGFARHGIEARHLRMYKNAADRESALFEQIVMPLVKQRNPQARQQAAWALEELGRLSGELRRALLRQALGNAF